MTRAPRAWSRTEHSFAGACDRCGSDRPDAPNGGSSVPPGADDRSRSAMASTGGRRWPEGSLPCGPWASLRYGRCGGAAPAEVRAAPQMSAQRGGAGQQVMAGEGRSALRQNSLPRRNGLVLARHGSADVGAGVAARLRRSLLPTGIVPPWPGADAKDQRPYMLQARLSSAAVSVRQRRAGAR